MVAIFCTNVSGRQKRGFCCHNPFTPHKLNGKIESQAVSHCLIIFKYFIQHPSIHQSGHSSIHPFMHPLIHSSIYPPSQPVTKSFILFLLRKLDPSISSQSTGQTTSTPTTATHHLVTAARQSDTQTTVQLSSAPVRISQVQNSKTKILIRLELL